MHPQIDDATFKFLIYVLGVTVSGLVGIIIFLAKGLNNNVKVIKDNQDRGAIETAEMKKDIAGLVQDLQQMRIGMNEINKIKEDLYKNSFTISAIEKTIEEHRASIKNLEDMCRELRRNKP